MEAEPGQQSKVEATSSTDSAHIAPQQIRRSDIRLRGSFYASLGLAEEPAAPTHDPNDDVTASVTGLAVSSARGRSVSRVSQASATSGTSQRVRLPSTFQEDLFDLIFSCQDSSVSTAESLLQASVERHHPLLAVFAATSGGEMQKCAAVWLVARFPSAPTEVQIEKEDPSEWNYEDLGKLILAYGRRHWFSLLQVTCVFENTC